MNTNSHALHLNGLNGTNPVAFLAAMGAFRLIAEAFPERTARLGWAPAGGSWTAVLHTSEETEPEQLVETLYKHLSSRANCSAFMVADNLKMPSSQFRVYATNATVAWMNDSDSV